MLWYGKIKLANIFVCFMVYRLTDCLIISEIKMCTVCYCTNVLLSLYYCINSALTIQLIFLCSIYTFMKFNNVILHI